MDPNRESGATPRHAATSRRAWLVIRAAAAGWLAVGVATLASGANWEVAPEVRGGKQACLLVSAQQPVFDGYQKVLAQIVLDGRTVVVKSDSVLDPGFADVGMAVANEPFIRIDRVEKRKQAVFEKEYARIVQLFKKGREVRVQLRFWPTWPATGTHSVSFSLMGFTKAYGDTATCR